MKLGISAREAGLALRACMTSVCPHETAVPVELLITGEVVAMLCERCLLELPIAWGCGDCEWVEDRRLCDEVPALLLGRPCTRHAVASTVA